MFRRPFPLLCYVDHAAHYQATLPKRPVAAFTGSQFPEHVTRALEGQAQRAGYRSQYWLSKAALKNHKVPLRPGAQGLSVCMETAGLAPLEVLHFEHVVPVDAVAFLQEFPLPDPLAGAFGEAPPDRDSNGQPAGHWIYRDSKWRRMSNRAASNAMDTFASSHRFQCKLWISDKAATMAGLQLVDGAHSIPITEIAPTFMFNAEQTTYPSEKFAPPYVAPGVAPQSNETTLFSKADSAASSGGLDVTETSRIALKLKKDQVWRAERLLNDRGVGSGKKRREDF